jgi:hypothetical protein
VIAGAPYLPNHQRRKDDHPKVEQLKCKLFAKTEHGSDAAELEAAESGAVVQWLSVSACLHFI